MNGESSSGHEDAPQEETERERLVRRAREAAKKAFDIFDFLWTQVAQKGSVLPFPKNIDEIPVSIDLKSEDDFFEEADDFPLVFAPIGVITVRVGNLKMVQIKLREESVENKIGVSSSLSHSSFSGIEIERESGSLGIVLPSGDLREEMIDTLERLSDSVEIMIRIEDELTASSKGLSRAEPPVSNKALSPAGPPEVDNRSLSPAEPSENPETEDEE